MNEDVSLALKKDESFEQFLIRLGECKSTYGLTWDDITDIINKEFNMNKTESTYRKWFSKNRNSDALNCEECSENYIDRYENKKKNELDEKILELQKERIRLADERSQYNAFMRRISREDTLKDIALEVAERMSKKPLYFDNYPDIKLGTYHTEAILLLSDIHYGIEIDNHINKYNPEICKDRLNRLLQEVIYRCDKNDVEKLYIMDLGDLISGRIHLQIRIQNRVDVITQVMEISEILAEFINTLSKYMLIEYHSCSDNHSRVEPIKENSLSLEQLSRLTPWYLKSRLSENKNVNICDNIYGEDIITFRTKYHSIAGVHGDKDRPNSVAKAISMYTQEKFDLICSAHLHHHNEDEQNMVDIICNGSVMGVDDFAHSLRASSKPSQTLIISTEKNVRDSVHKIVLD